MKSAYLIKFTHFTFPIVLGLLMSEESPNTIPRDALVMDEILRQMGVREYDPRVVAQLLEFTHRYVSELIKDADDYRQHAGRDKLSLGDVQVARETRDQFSFTPSLPREITACMAKETNLRPLPAVKPRFGVVIPPRKYCLTLPNYQVNRTDE